MIYDAFPISSWQHADAKKHGIKFSLMNMANLYTIAQTPMNSTSDMLAKTRKIWMRQKVRNLWKDFYLKIKYLTKS